MAQIECNECSGQIKIGVDVMLGEVLQCPDCGLELEVVGLDPLQIELAPEIEEDWGE
ncbi:MAG: lysine biosynthesis protein LysW [Anaerolineales bacterium]|nr:lysine biosynthesis protein LysW [Anaerolineales bacterium]